ncbi:MAG: methionyl-tRNA formyltransferase [Tannerella sp.]|jgi:methionyl-tRNA formyltransferase|nr:methionyl-tRNA formyltransferase [Tannerella sp.]
MDKETVRIVFMGTPEFAVASLRALVEGGYRVVGVVTAPDKPVGRHGSILQPAPVKLYAQQQGIPVLQPEKLRDEDFLAALRALKADLQIVVAFRMLPEVVWNMPPLGTFNLHASLLPQYRGAAPIHWAIINGEKETGVTTFFLTHTLDTGRIIRRRPLPIEATDDAGSLHDKLMLLGAALVLETARLILAHGGQVDTIPQETLLLPGVVLRPAPKIFKDTCRICWQQPAQAICDFIRGLSPHPAAWTEWRAEGAAPQPMKVFRAESLPGSHTLAPGTVRIDGACLDVAATDGFVRLLSVQLAGKRRLEAKDFLNGTRLVVSG